MEKFANKLKPDNITNGKSRDESDSNITEEFERTHTRIVNTPKKVKQETTQERDKLYIINFYYHSEPIELLDYYTKNIKNLKQYANNKTNFIVNIFVSNFKSFFDKLDKKSYEIEIDISGTDNIEEFENIQKDDICIIKLQETEKNHIYGLYYKIIYDGISINIIKLISIPNMILFKKYIEHINHEEIKEYLKNFETENDIEKCNALSNIHKYLEKENILVGNKSIGFKRYAALILCINYQENTKYIYIPVYNWQIDYGSILGIPAIYFDEFNKLKIEGFNFNKKSKDKDKDKDKDNGKEEIDDKPQKKSKKLKTGGNGKRKLEDDFVHDIIFDINNDKNILLLHHHNIKNFRNKIKEKLCDDDNTKQCKESDKYISKKILLENVNFLKNKYFWYKGRKYLNNEFKEIKNEFIYNYNKYDKYDKYEELRISKYMDFYYFYLLFDIYNEDVTMFCAMNINDNIYLLENDKKIYIMFKGFNADYLATGNQSKPKTTKNGKLKMGHYDKFNIININLLKDKNEKKDNPYIILYNKNFTKINEDIYFTNILMKKEKYIIPHIFLAVTKCQLKDEKKKINEPKTELLYMFNSKDDIDNYKMEGNIGTFDFSTKFEVYNEYKANGGNILSDNLSCDIKYKTATKTYTEIKKIGQSIYISKVFDNIFLKYINDNSKIIFDKLLEVYMKDIKITPKDIKKLMDIIEQNKNIVNYDNCKIDDLKIYDLKNFLVGKYKHINSNIDKDVEIICNLITKAINNIINFLDSIEELPFSDIFLLYSKNENIDKIKLDKIINIIQTSYEYVSYIKNSLNDSSDLFDIFEKIKDKLKNMNMVSGILKNFYTITNDDPGNQKYENMIKLYDKIKSDKSKSDESKSDDIYITEYELDNKYIFIHDIETPNKNKKINDKYNFINKIELDLNGVYDIKSTEPLKINFKKINKDVTNFYINILKDKEKLFIDIEDYEPKITFFNENYVTISDKATTKKITSNDKRKNPIHKMEVDYYDKYMKYKAKYLQLKNSLYNQKN
jgi:hypothetical protein